MSKHRGFTPLISLFPFLNVLVSVLGVLIMIMLAISAISLGAGRTVRISVNQEKMDVSLKPVYIEWDGIDVIIYPENIVVSAVDAFENNGRNDSAFSELLDRMESNKETMYIIAAIRPSGFHNFFRLRDIILNREIRIGYEPIDQRWDLAVGKEKKDSRP